MEQSSEQAFVKFIGFIVKKRKILLPLSIIVILFIIILTIVNINSSRTPQSAFEQYNKDSGTISITNLSQAQTTSIPQAVTDKINQEIYKTIKYNVTPDTDIDNLSDVAVRKDTYSDTHNKKTDTHDIKFIIDIPSIQQSYRISYRWIPHDNNSPYAINNPMVSCPTSSQLIYGEFDCKDLYLINDIDRGTTISGPNYNDRFLSRITPYSTIILDEITYTAKTKYDENKNPYIEISFNTCDAGNLVDSAKASYNNYLQKFDLKLSDYRTKTVVQECDF